MAVIYSYPTVIPTANDLVLGTDVDAADKPTKNFTVQSIIDLVTVSGNDLQAVLNNGNTATQNIILTGNISATQYTDGTMSIVGGVGSGFSSITSTDFAGNLTGIVKAGSSIESTVTGVTQAQGDNSTKLATTAYVDGKVDTSVLQYLGDATGPFDLNLVNDDFKIAGTANEIITTATTVAGNVGTITLAFPSGGVTLPNGSIATTQLATDNSTKVATTAFVHSHSAAQDLSFIGDSGSGTVLLDSQQLDLEGTPNQIVTQASGQKVIFSLPGSVTISGTYTGATFSGDLNGTINTATTGVTQAPGNNSTKIATTAYVDAAAGAKTLSYKDNNATVHTLNLTSDDLEFLGDSNITVTAAAVAANVGTITVDLNNSVNISGTMTAGTFTDGTFTGSSGTYTGYASISSTTFIGALSGNASTASSLASTGTIELLAGSGATKGVSSNAQTYTSGGNVQLTTSLADTTVTGKTLTNLPTPTSSAISASDTILAAMAKLQGQITATTGLAYEGTWDPGNSATAGGTPDLRLPANKVNGHFYICSAAGIGTPNGNGTTPNSWATGDWVIYVSNGSGTDEWQKLDQTNEITGSGAANKIAKWTGTNTLGTGLIEDNATTVTIGNSGNLSVEGNTTLGDTSSDTTLIKGTGTADKNFIIHEGLGVGTTPDYGSAGQILSSGGSAAAANVWIDNDQGTVTSIATNNGLTGGTITTSGTLGILTTGTSNAIEFLSSATPASGDLVWFSDINDSNTLRKCTVADLQGPIGGPFLPLAGGTMVGNILRGDNISDKYGAGNDLTIVHNGTDSQITNITGNLQFTNTADDKDITFATDDGSGGDAIYVTLDGSATTTVFSKNTRHDDNVLLQVGSGNDAAFYHNATDTFLTNSTGDLKIRQFVDDGDIVFDCDDGSGGVATYFKLDGSLVNGTTTLGATNFPDKSKIFMGTGSDLRIYHDGTDSYLENATGDLIVKCDSDDLVLRAADDIFMEVLSGANAIKAIGGGAVELYHNNVQKFSTTSSGIGVTGNGDFSGEIYVGGANSVFAENVLRFYSAGAGYIDHNTTGQNVIFRVSNANPLDTQIMRLLSNGFVELSQYGSGKSGTPAYNLEVDSNGKVITTPSTNPGGGGGTFHGDQAITTAGGSTLAFTLTRATTGTLVFDVWLTSETSTGTSVAKKYVVAHSYNTTPVYNKILDTGPRGSADFTVAFANSNTGATGTSVVCNLTAVNDNQNIGYTVQVGYDSTNALTFTAAS